MSLFNERLRQLRDESKLTSAKLAEKLGIAASTLSLYMKDREPNYDTLIKIASYFHVTTDWLIGNSEFRTKANTISDPIKSLGSYTVNVKLYEGVIAKLKISVVGM